MSETPSTWKIVPFFQTDRENPFAAPQCEKSLELTKSID